MQDLEQENLNASLPLHDNDSCKSSEQLAKEIEGELVENPNVLEQLLERPQFRAIVSQTYFRGPLPPPSMLREYDDIVEGAAERIMARSEKEQAHRHEMQKTTVTGTIKKDRRGQWMAYSITLLILLIATVFAWKGNTVFAGTLITVDLIGLASVFIMGRASGLSRQMPTPDTNEEE
ncbi:TPA: DUF2335 domain-containing protein [Escherichia coli]|uniref:DUF2335 domain-containing protein n=2 Tax=Escherichia coli TaxID=562 RepID=UPI0017F92966|nr:DUF2335 domain-containing protein [Escherichia coli]EFC9335580.1 DUF2335 domain-containing protein [Escherichia coli]EFD0057043.1 DUF2335 domain-containing protein [Escherichia coli]EFD0084452.1 DUF2335 domain-containing protein [Escherichia coli]EJA1186302.1 DUF2335 domain-containing protein [Escherichia coli]MCT6447325.1 DUF2335 domain-containing protein [Escherichia coli]